MKISFSPTPVILVKAVFCGYSRTSHDTPFATLLNIWPKKGIGFCNQIGHLWIENNLKYESRRSLNFVWWRGPMNM